MSESAAELVDHVLPDFPIRQWVFTVPFPLHFPLSFAGGQYGESALRDVLPVDLTGIPSDGPRAFSTDSFKPRLSAAGRNHPVTSLSLDPKANEAR